MYRVVLYLSVAASAYAASAPNLMPWPAKMVRNPGQLRIDSGFRIASSGATDAHLQAAMVRLTARIFRQAGLSAIPLPNAQPALTVDCREPVPDVPVLGIDETYQLD